jgi:hypothetical protein
VGLTPIIWNRDTLDWTFQNYNGITIRGAPGPPKLVDGDWIAQTPQQIPQLFKIWVDEVNFTTSAISLQHDLYDFSAKEVPGSLDALMNTRFQIVDVLQCRKIMNPYSDELLVKAKMPLTFLDPPPANLDISSGKDPNKAGYYYYGNSSFKLMPTVLSILSLAAMLLAFL